MAKTLQQFREWAMAAGTVANPGTGSYPGQCVSLIQQYVNQVFMIPYAPRGNAKDYTPPTFKRVTGAYRPGDVIRYGANYGGGYGHVGMIDDDGMFLDQNGVKHRAVGRRAKPFSGIESIWRPTKPLQIKTPAPVKQDYVYLPSSVSQWRFYRENVKPVKGNESYFLNPKKYGGLQYKVVRYSDGGTTAVIDSPSLGRGKVYIRGTVAQIRKI